MNHSPSRPCLAITLALGLVPASAAAAEPGEPAAPAESPEVAESPESPTPAPGELVDEPKPAPSESESESDPSAVPDVVPDREAVHAPVEAEANATLLSLEEGIELALRRHPRIAMARRRVTAAKARVGQAKAAYMPRVDAGVQYVWASENGSPASVHTVPGMSRVGGARRPGVTWNDAFHNDLVALAVNQVIYDFGRTKGTVGAQRAAVLAVEMELAQAEQQVAFGVTRAFYEVQASREGVRVAEDIRVTALAILELADAARKVGLKPPSESARAEANVAAAEVALIQAKARLEMARASVAGALGVLDETYLPREDELPLGEVPDEEQSIERALQSRPELELLGHRRTGLQEDLRRVKAQRLPRFDARASVNARGQFLPTAGLSPYQVFNWNIGVVISIPVFQGMAVRRQMDEIGARVEVVDANQELIRQAVTVEVRQALAAVRAADAAMVASERGVKAARLALETLEGRYGEGLARLVELTDAQATYISAQRQLVQAKYDRYRSRALLDFATGQLPR